MKKNEKILSALRDILEYLGEDPDREGLKETPNRMMRSWGEIFGGYNEKPEDLFTVFYEDGVIPKGQIILLKDIEFYSTCEHHFLPFAGKAHVAYIPRDRIVGISKLARLVELYSRRLQIQERICNQVVNDLMKYLNAQSAACIIEAQHLCMACRGVKKQHSVMTTSALRGGFLTDHRTRMELLTLVKS